MKTTETNAQQPETRDPAQAHQSARARLLSSQHLPRILLALAVLLLLDVAFVLIESSSGSNAAQEPGEGRVKVVLLASVTPTSAPTTTSIPTRAVATPTPSASPSSTATSALVKRATGATTAVTPTATVSSGNNTVAAAAEVCSNPVGKLVTDTISSKVLGYLLPVHVYLPPCYDGTRYTYPALYLIQGSAFALGEWVMDGVPRVADLQMSLGILPPFIVVMPGSDLNGGGGGRYLYSTGGKGSWEDFMLNELVPMIETKYSAWPSREGRAIGGISRGGYWSLEIGFTHPDLFSAVGGHSPSITPDKLIGVSANFSMLSFVKSMDTLKTTRIWLDSGSTDWAQNGVNRLSKDLDAKGIAYSVSSGDGGHEDAYWASRVPDYLAFYSANWPHTARAKSVSAGTAADSQGAQP